MKKKIAIGIIVGLLFAGVLAGACYVYLGDLYTYSSRHVLTLKDFSDDDSLRAGPANFVVVSFWQGSPDVAAGEPVAVIPYSFPYDKAFTFCWETGAAIFNEYMMFHYANGREVFRLDAGGDCVTEVLASAAYEMRFYRDDTTSELPIFIRPFPDIAFTWFDPYSPPEPTQFILTTNVCRECNLAGGDFFQANFEGCDFTKADLTNAYLYRANLTDAILTDATLSGANLSLATWTDGRTCAEGSSGTCD